MTRDATVNLSLDHGSVVATREPALGDGEDADATEFYCILTGSNPAVVRFTNDYDFDRHVFACILALASTEAGGTADRSGLDAKELDRVLAQWFPNATLRNLDHGEKSTNCDQEEIEMLRDPLVAHRSSDGDVGRLLAAMISRRAMEPNHLWEDLGLRDRSELTRLLEQHFQPLAERNVNNMRWKRFFYRVMCENDGFVMCSTPVCTNCGDYHLCFGVEDGQSRLT